MLRAALNAFRALLAAPRRVRGRTAQRHALHEKGGHAGAVRALLRAMRPRDPWDVRDARGRRPIEVATGDAREALIQARVSAFHGKMWVDAMRARVGWSFSREGRCAVLCRLRHAHGTPWL